MNKQLFPLALGGLGIGTTEFVIMGLLPDVAQSLQISIPVAGYLIAAYAIGVVIGAPLLVAMSAKYPPKKVLIGLMILFTIFNAISAVAPQFYSLLLARFFSGLPHGAFFGVGTVVATRLAREGKKAQAISMMFTGLTVANLAMVPLVTFIGHEWHWRIAFAIVSVIGLLTILFLKFWLPDIADKRETGIAEEMKFFATKKSWLILSITAIGFAGLFSWLSYIAPLMTDVAGFASSSISYIMILAGAGMVAGNLLGGYLADKMPPAKAAAGLFLLLFVALIAVFLFSESQPASLILTFLCGALSMAVGAPSNMLMLQSAKKSEMMGAAFMQAAFNVANFLGAFVGGLPLKAGLTYNYPSLAGAVMVMAGLVLLLIYVKNFQPLLALKGYSKMKNTFRYPLDILHSFRSKKITSS